LTFDIKVNMSRHGIAEICEKYNYKKYIFIARSQDELQRCYAAGAHSKIMLSVWDGAYTDNVINDEYIDLLRQYDTSRLFINFADNGDISQNEYYEENARKVREIGCGIIQAAWGIGAKNKIEKWAKYANIIYSDYRQGVVELGSKVVQNDSGWFEPVFHAGSNIVNNGSGSAFMLRKINNEIFMIGGFTITLDSINKELINFRNDNKMASDLLSSYSFVKLGTINNVPHWAKFMMYGTPRMFLHSVYDMSGNAITANNQELKVSFNDSFIVNDKTNDENS
jgi:hypothetical protein